MHWPKLATLSRGQKKLRISIPFLLVFKLVLLGAWVCIVIYSKRTFSLDGRANFFRGITIFCWVMAIIYNIVYIFGLNKSKACFGQPSNFTIVVSNLKLLRNIYVNINCDQTVVVRPRKGEHKYWWRIGETKLDDDAERKWTFPTRTFGAWVRLSKRPSKS